MGIYFRPVMTGPSWRQHRGGCSP